MCDLLDSIRQAIKASGMSRYRIAQESGIEQSALSRLMSGERGLSVESVEKLAEVLEFEIIVRRKSRRKGS